MRILAAKVLPSPARPRSSQAQARQHRAHARTISGADGREERPRLAKRRRLAGHRTGGVLTLDLGARGQGSAGGSDPSTLDLGARGQGSTGGSDPGALYLDARGQGSVGGFDPDWGGLDVVGSDRFLCLLLRRCTASFSPRRAPPPPPALRDRLHRRAPPSLPGANHSPWRTAHQEITQDRGVITFEDVAAANAIDGAERLGVQESQPPDTRRLGARGNAQQRRRRSCGGFHRIWVRRSWGFLLRGRRLRTAPETHCSLHGARRWRARNKVEQDPHGPPHCSHLAASSHSPWRTARGAEIRDTSVFVKLRPAWEDLRSYLTAKGRKRFEVYICTMAERDYALEMWRLLDPEGSLINLQQLSQRVVCVKSGFKKSLQNVFGDRGCHPKMAMVI